MAETKIQIEGEISITLFVLFILIRLKRNHKVLSFFLTMMEA